MMTMRDIERRLLMLVGSGLTRSEVLAELRRLEAELTEKTVVAYPKAPSEVAPRYARTRLAVALDRMSRWRPAGHA
jgi:hypothetical protein